MPDNQRVDLMGKTNYFIGGNGYNGQQDNRQQKNFIGTIHSLSITRIE